MTASPAMKIRRSGGKPPPNPECVRAGEGAGLPLLRGRARPAARTGDPAPSAATPPPVCPGGCRPTWAETPEILRTRHAGPDRTVEQTIPDRVVRMPVRVDERLGYDPPAPEPLAHPASVSGSIQIVDHHGMPARNERDGVDPRAPVRGTGDLSDPVRDFVFFGGTSEIGRAAARSPRTRGGPRLAGHGVGR
jgi:hypothetical protein